MNALQTFVSNPNPSPNPNQYLRKPSSMAISCSTPSAGFSRFLRSSTSKPSLARLALNFRRRRNFNVSRSFVLSAASHDERKHVEIKVEGGKSDLDLKAKESHEAWKKTLESFKEQATKMQGLSKEAYEVYSKKSMEILIEASKQLKIQAEKASHDLAEITEELSKDGKVYLSAAAENSPEPVKDIVETFASSSDDLKEVSEVRDFYLGIPYGIFLSLRGFLSFMLTGSIPAIRFGVILGGALLVLSIYSLRLWKQGKTSALLLKGQLAIASILFLRELRLLSQRSSLTAAFMTLISGIMVVFYLYRIIIDGEKKEPIAEQSFEN